ncbi:MAG: adenylyl-sulfate kinase [Acidobacteria bacterium]|nr:MAG: adenylyl-sulfate kinase [Acidobacteriota bacterium]
MKKHCPPTICSLTKSITWQAVASLATMAVFYLLTGEFTFAVLAGAVEWAVNFLLSFGRQHLWAKNRPEEGQTQPIVIWLTGLSGAGKSTIAKLLVKKFKENKLPVQWLDGDVTREFIPATGFSREERDRHVLSTGFMARTLEQQGVNVVASYISPYRETREKVRAMCRNFFEVYLSTPLETCENRDVKGLYQQARAGAIKQFTGIDDPFEAPFKPDLELDTTHHSPEETSEVIFRAIQDRLHTQHL